MVWNNKMKLIIVGYRYSNKLENDALYVSEAMVIACYQ